MIKDEYKPLDLENFHIRALEVDSKALKNNPLGDPTRRNMPCLVPKKGKIKAVVWVLAGFSGNGPNYMNLRGFEANFAENLDVWLECGSAPNAVYIFVDAWTLLGGSQFLNSPAVGNYEDYIVKDLYSLVKAEYPDLPHAVMGGSSGGYGALHLASKYPAKFSYLGAIAPDAYFEALFLPEFYKTKNFFARKGSDVKKLIVNGELMQLRDWHSILNVYAMSACYSANKKIEIPFDFKLGTLKTDLWKQWKKLDPVVFLVKRTDKLKKLKGIFLEVGNKDQFHLQFGARQIHEAWKVKKISHHYSEFDGSHFDLSTRREPFLKWLKKQV